MNHNWVGPSRDCHVGKRVRVGPSRDSHFVNKLEVCWKLASLRFRADGELQQVHESWTLIPPLKTKHCDVRLFETKGERSFVSYQLCYVLFESGF